MLLSGTDGVPLRVREELDSLGVAWRAVEDPTDAASWSSIAEATAVGLLGPDDLVNLNAALLVAELHPDCRIVVRLFSSQMRAGVERMLGGRGLVLSETELAAPVFLQAALQGNVGQQVTAAGRRLEVAEVHPDDQRVVCVLCNVDSPTEVFPPREAWDPTVLALIDPEGVVYTARGALPASVVGARRPARVRAPRRPHGVVRLIPGRAYLLMAVILTVFATSVAVFGLSDHLGFVDAIYFTATTMATVGYGDVNLSGAPDWLKLYDVGLMAVSAVLLASVLALVTDVLVTSRIDRALGRFPRPRRDHVIVCGLGKAGTGILRGLAAAGVPCVGVEQHEDAVGIPVARSLHVPVVLGDARTPGTLHRLHSDQARAVMAVTNDDLANLQVGLAAREDNPDARVVLRMFDPNLAERLDNTVELDLTRSVSGLAAPAFAAALLGWPIAQPLALSNVPLRVLDVASPGEATVGAMQQTALRVLAVDGRWRPADDVLVTPGVPISVIGTRDACDALLSWAHARAS